MRLHKHWSWSNVFTPPPLVDAQTVARLHVAAHATTAPALLAKREVQHLLLGERQSAFVGRGYEFAENRPYTQGDEARFINWRVLARTGEFYRKTFYEERRPPVWLILDRGESMRFGTRVRLKLALASQLALYHLFLAQRHALATGAVLFDTQDHWFSPARAGSQTQALIEVLCAPAPPLARPAQGNGLMDVLQQCLVQLAPGCMIFIYSDFQQLKPRDVALLHALSQRHTVAARHVVDPSEIRLPDSGAYQFVRGDDDMRIDCNEAALGARYAQRMQQRHADIAGWLAQAGIEYQRYRADDDLFAEG